MRYKIIIITIITILWGVTSCATRNLVVKVYDGPERDKASLASIERDKTPNAFSINGMDGFEYALLYKVDTISVTRSKNGISPKRCEILPGTHTIEVFHKQIKKFKNRTFITTNGRYLITFEAKAGETYIVKADTDPLKREVDVYVINNSSGERIESTAKYRYTLKDKE